MTGFDEGEFERWLSQALHTRSSAQRDLDGRDFAWSCFKAQQAAEYALKALLRGLAQPGHGHSLTRLLKEVRSLGLDVPDIVAAAAQVLDRHYVPTRYPDAFPEGSPHEYYNRNAAEEAGDAADKVIAWVQSAN